MVVAAVLVDGDNDAIWAAGPGDDVDGACSVYLSTEDVFSVRC